MSIKDTLRRRCMTRSRTLLSSAITSPAGEKLLHWTKSRQVGEKSHRIPRKKDTDVNNDMDKKHAFLHSLRTLCSMLVPFKPFLLLWIWQNIPKTECKPKRENTIHYILAKSPPPQCHFESIPTFINLAQRNALPLPNPTCETSRHHFPTPNLREVHGHGTVPP